MCKLLEKWAMRATKRCTLGRPAVDGMTCGTRSSVGVGASGDDPAYSSRREQVWECFHRGMQQNSGPGL